MNNKAKAAQKNGPDYIGFLDRFSFGRGKHFGEEDSTGKKFDLRLTNTSAADKVIGFSPALLAGLPVADLNKKVSNVDGWVLKDGLVATKDGAGELTGLADPNGGNTGEVRAESQSSENTLDLLLLYCFSNPARIVRMDMNSEKDSQFSTKIEQRIINPFQSANGELSISLRNFVSSDQFQSDKAEILLIKHNIELMFAPDTVIYLTVKKNNVFEINMDFGAIDNSAFDLRRRASFAHSNIRRRGLGVQQTK